MVPLAKPGVSVPGLIVSPLRSASLEALSAGGVPRVTATVYTFEVSPSWAVTVTVMVVTALSASVTWWPSASASASAGLIATVALACNGVAVTVVLAAAVVAV